MLYNVDDDKTEEIENEDINFEETPRSLNKRKIVGLISAVLICLLILLGSLLLTYHGMGKKENGKEESMVSNIAEKNNIAETLNTSNTETTGVTVNFNNEKKENSSNDNIVSITDPTENEDKKALKYIGAHSQIPVHSEENIQKGFVPGENPNAQEEIKQIYSSKEKQVYLTFDDGPSKEITPKILDVLKQEDVLATFFVLGSRVELNPTILQREYNEGHYIANHGYSHKYSQIYSSVESVYDEYMKCQQAVQNALGNPNYYTRLFRFPGGSSGGKYNDLKAKAKQDLNSKGIVSTNWNSLTGDAEGITDKQKLIDRMIKTIGNSQSVILLMHDAGDKSYTLEALPEVIKYFKDRGYVFKNFYEIFNQ